MPTTKPNRRATSGAPGAKALITAAALAGTIGGWALLAGSQPSATLPPATSAVQLVAQPGVAQLPPMPTLVPAPVAAPAASAPVVQPAPRAASVPARPQPVTSTRSSR